MAFNPMDMFKIRERLRLFEEQHVRFPLFLRDVGEHAVQAGSVVEVKVTDPQGKEYISNIRLTPDDIETIEMIRRMKQKQ